MLGNPSATNAVVVSTIGNLALQVAVLDGTTGNDLWQRPGRASYADGLATGDGGTYVLDKSNGIAAYKLDSGDVRWQIGSRLGEVAECCCAAPWRSGNTFDVELCGDRLGFARS